MDLLQAYRQEIERRDLIEDQVQIEAVERLQRLAIDMERYERSRAGLLTRLFARQKAPKGLWLWGGVGRGKSFIMDLFFESLDVERKGRFHFHEFMREVHRELGGPQRPS
jgi:cell division protein ZapE